MDYESIIDGYDKIREQCYKIVKSDLSILGDFNWLRAAIQEEDIQLSILGGDIQCSGYCYTTQTMSSEYFYFIVPVKRIEENLNA